MNPKRYQELMWGPDPQTLTKEELAEGWHFCGEWDDLLICPMDGEWGTDAKQCRCGWKNPKLK